MNDQIDSADVTKSKMKQLTHFLSRSSKQFLSALLNDEWHNRKEVDSIKEQINNAITQKSIVIVHYRTRSDKKKSYSYQTVTGRLYRHDDNPHSLVVKSPNTNHVFMLATNDIKKITVIHNPANKSYTK